MSRFQEVQNVEKKAFHAPVGRWPIFGCLELQVWLLSLLVGEVFKANDVLVIEAIGVFCSLSCTDAVQYLFYNSRLKSC